MKRLYPKDAKDIYIKDEGEIHTLIAQTERAEKLFKEQFGESVYFNTKVDIEAGQLHKIISWAVSHNLSVDSEISIVIPAKEVNYE